MFFLPLLINLMHPC